eukprot:366395-Chlamydomonas_euryale.AAC.9
MELHVQTCGAAWGRFDTRELFGAALLVARDCMLYGLDIRVLLCAHARGVRLQVGGIIHPHVRARICTSFHPSELLLCACPQRRPCAWPIQGAFLSLASALSACHRWGVRVNAVLLVIVAGLVCLLWLRARLLIWRAQRAAARRKASATKTKNPNWPPPAAPAPPAVWQPPASRQETPNKALHPPGEAVPTPPAMPGAPAPLAAGGAGKASEPHSVVLVMEKSGTLPRHPV